MKVKKFNDVYACDFETTVYKGQERTDVWASAFVKLHTEDVVIHGNIKDTINYFSNLKQNVMLYYHNLKFDGSFILDYLLNHGYKQAFLKTANDSYEPIQERYMDKCTFKYSISDMGQWYNLIIKTKFNKIIEIRDSYKILPFPLRKIGKDFKTKHQKLEMEYEGLRYPDCEITQDEREYIKNDVLVLKEALEIMYSEGHDDITIGSCCLSEFKKTLDEEDYNIFFPDLTKITLDESFGAKNADSYIRRSYRGGWCYVSPKIAGIPQGKGTTSDVNSLYPSMMSSESGNRFPVGLPKFWQGNFIPDEATKHNRYYFVRLECEFDIKENHLPFIQIKCDKRFKATEMLTTSKVIDKKGDKTRYFIDNDGLLKVSKVTLTMTCTDYLLFQKHYNLYNVKILDGCYFNTEIGIFDKYINKYREIKMNSEGAIRAIAKLFLNNLYGKLAMSDNSSFKYAYLKEDGSVGFISVEEHNKKVGYIPCGSAITSYARNFTIKAAQNNYDIFCYSDTDSIHCLGDFDDIKGVKYHPTQFNCWSPESRWDKSVFVRQKTYIEHLTVKDEKEIDSPYYDVKCAGMPDKCKKLFVTAMEGLPYNKDEYEEEEIDFLEKYHNCNLTDFSIGLKVPGKLMPMRIPGGTLLVATSYEMR